MRVKYKLGELCIIKSGGTPSRNNPSFFDGDIPWAKISDIEKSNGFLLDTEEKISKEGLEDINNRFFLKGTLLFAMYGSVGKVTFSGIDLATNQAILGITIDKKEILFDRYLYYWFLANKQRLLDSARGVALQNLSATIIKDLDINLPDLNTQIESVQRFDSVSALIKKRRETIKLADEFLRSTFLEMFGDPANNTKQYPIVNLNELCSKITDGTHDTPARLSEGVKFITGKHIRPFIIDYDNSDYVAPEVHKEIYRRCNPEYGDVLYTNIGVNLGTAAMNTVDYEFSMKNVALLKIDSEQISSRYLEHILNNENMKRKILSKAMVGGAQQFLSLHIINEIEIPVPGLADQTKFSEIVNKVQVLKSKYNKSLIEMENQFNSLMQKAFRGEL